MITFDLKVKNEVVRGWSQVFHIFQVCFDFELEEHHGTGRSLRVVCLWLAKASTNSITFMLTLAVTARQSSRACRAPWVRCLHQSLPTYMPRVSKAKPAARRPEPLTEEEFMEMMDQDIKGDDTTTLGHYMLQVERQNLYYLRLIEHEMPNLVG
jgi:hypothetical protein